MKKLILLFILISTITKAQDYKWTQSFGGTNSDYSRGVVIDKAGNMYIAGSFKGTVDFNPGSGTDSHTSGTYDDIYIVKLDASGNFIWAKTYGSADYDYPNAIAIDESANLYIAGTFTGTTDLNPSSSSTDAHTSNGSYDVFIEKLDSAGKFKWGKSFGGTGSDYVRSIALDASDNVYVTGYYADEVDFDPSSGTDKNTSKGGDDVYIEKLDASGNFVWVTTFGGSSTDKGYGIATDVSGNVYVTGSFTDTVDFKPFSIVSFEHISNGGTDIFVEKLNDAGSAQWVRTFGSTQTDYGLSLGIDASNNISVTGYFEDVADFDPSSSGTDSHTSKGGYDVFVQKLDASGNFKWAQTYGGTSDDYPSCIATDSKNANYVIGNFKGTADFDPSSSGTDSHTSSGSADIFIQKLDSLGNFQWTHTFGGSSGDYGYYITTDASNNLYSLGYFEYTIDFDPTSGTDSHTSNNGYYDVFISKYGEGCNNSYGSINASECYSYASPSGNYNWTSSGTYTDTIANTGGCDSIITITLTIETVDTSVTFLNNILAASASSATFQWLDCDNGYTFVTAQTSQIFIPTSSGNYAVMVTQNGCTDTSSCYAITVVDTGSGSSIQENSFEKNITISPNPTKGALNILLEKNYNTIELEIHNCLGEKIEKQIYSNTQTINLTINAPQGIYFLMLKNDQEQKALIKVLKE